MELSSVLSDRISEIRGRRATVDELAQLKGELNNLIPDWFLDLIHIHPLIGCRFQLSREHDLSGLGVDLEWMSPGDVLTEACKMYPGIAAARVGYFPFGTCMDGSGDPYFLRASLGERGPVVRIPHDAVSKNLQLAEQSIELVKNCLAEFLATARIE